MLWCWREMNLGRHRRVGFSRGDNVRKYRCHGRQHARQIVAGHFLIRAISSAEADIGLHILAAHIRSTLSKKVNIAASA